MPNTRPPTLAEIAAIEAAIAEGEPITTYWLARVGVGGVPVVVRFAVRDGALWAEAEGLFSMRPAVDLLASLHATGWWRWDDITGAKP